MAQFKDNFSKQAGIYARYRPGYPPGLFQYLASLTNGHDLAWDCGTGNGQSALGLTQYYKMVYATDPSAEQLNNAVPHEKIRYRAEKAEQPGLEDGSVDLVTIAQALHWFHFDSFYSSVRRVLKPGGIIAAWAYGLPAISDGIDETIYRFHEDTLGNYWLAENRLIDQEYTTIPFPFAELRSPRFEIQKHLSLYELIGLINSWSAVQRFIGLNGYDPLNDLAPKLTALWPDPHERKLFTWKLILRVGKNSH